MIMMPMTKPGGERALRGDVQADRLAQRGGSAAPRSGRRRSRRPRSGCRPGSPGSAWRQARNVGLRVLRQVDRGEHADRARHQHGDDGDQQRAGEQRDRAEGTRRADLVGAHRGLRAPLQPEQELGDRDLPKKRIDSNRTEKMMPGGGRDRDAGSEPQDTVTQRSTTLRARKSRWTLRSAADRQKAARATPATSRAIRLKVSSVP